VKIKAWIEAMRLRTLPVSVAGVITAVAFNVMTDTFCGWKATLCMFFAVLAQIASNFANEYYDFKAGLDRKGREGPRRGVTEGDITPRAMKIATYGTLCVACIIGVTIAYTSGWWLIPVGVLIALGVVAYSAGPYPLSRHGLGEVAVLFFFGIIPVNLTYYVQAGAFDPVVALSSISLGLMGANVLIVNNYRDANDDRVVGKRTLAVIIGQRAVSGLYLFNGYIAVALMFTVWLSLGWIACIVPIVYLLLHTLLWHKINISIGAALNPKLGMTACLMAAYAIALLVAV